MLLIIIILINKKTTNSSDIICPSPLKILTTGVLHASFAKLFRNII